MLTVAILVEIKVILKCRGDSQMPLNSIVSQSYAQF